MRVEDNINVSLDNETHHLLDKLAKEESKSSAIMAASLIKEAIDARTEDARTEDMLLSNHAETRLKNVKNWHSHDEAWR